MKVILDIGDNSEPVLRFSAVVGSNSTDQKILKKKFIDEGFDRSLHVTAIGQEKEPLEKGEKREYEIRINND